MKKCTWVIDNVLLERHDEGYGILPIAQAAEKLGHEVFITKYVPFSDYPDFDFNITNPEFPLILYGSIQFLNQIERVGLFKYIGLPGAYFKKEALKYSNYSWRYPGLMLNDRWIMLPYGEIKRRLDEDIHDGLIPPHFPNHKFFIRPDVVTKSFAGRVINFDSEEENHKTLSKYETVSDEELCVISDEVDIIGEYRHIICDREIVGQSQYRRDGKLDIRTDVDVDCQNLAKYVAQQEYQPDIVYTLDTALTVDGPRIVEFNAFSCSGLYACDTENIVKRVSEAAWKEFNGDDID